MYGLNGSGDGAGLARALLAVRHNATTEGNVLNSIIKGGVGPFRGGVSIKTRLFVL